MLGKGNFGKVYKCTRRRDKQTFAVKVINVANLDDDKLKGVLNEKDLMQKIRHQNIVRLEDCIQEKNKLYIVMELATGGDLAQLIQLQKNRFEEETIL